jgi:hypothetical protein
MRLLFKCDECGCKSEYPSNYCYDCTKRLDKLDMLCHRLEVKNRDLLLLQIEVKELEKEIRQLNKAHKKAIKQSNNQAI